jgi:hypothetical protein
MRNITLIVVGVLVHMVGIHGGAIGQTAEVVEAAVPSYPKLPSGGRENGEVKVEVKIGPTGVVTAAKAISGPERLRSTAEFAASKWRFAAGKAQSREVELVFAFIRQLGVGDPPATMAVFKPPNRMEIFAEEREVITIADPQMVDVEKERKKKR